MAVEEDSQLHWGDVLVILGYFAAVITVGIWSSCRNRGSVGGYFLAGRSMHWIPIKYTLTRQLPRSCLIRVGASLFASNIGSGHFVGLAGSGAANGIGIAVFELNAIFILMMLGWLFVPVYVASGVFTLPEYLRKRFGGQRIRVYLAVLALVLYVFTKISADLYSGALFITQAVDMNLYLAVIILLIVAAFFSIAGGLTAVIWTDFIQVVIMVIGAFILMIMSFVKVGGYEAVVEKYFTAWPETTRRNYGSANDTYWECGIPPENSMNLVRSYDDGSLPWPGIMFGLTISSVWYWCSDQAIDCTSIGLVRAYGDGSLPWPGIMFGLTISSVWYWCSDQVIVQRALAAKNLSNAKAGTILAGYLKFLPLWLLVFPGMISRILYPDDVGCAEPDKCEEICGSRKGCTNVAYPLLVLRLMPTGLKGLMLAVMMSALISSLTSIFNSSSTILTMDIWRRFRKHASEIELMIVGRMCIVVLTVVSVVWIPIVQNFGELFHYIQAITSYLAPPVCAVYVLAMFWKRTNEPGAFWGLMVGLVVGLIRFAWEYSYSVPPCGEGDKDNRPAVITDVHYLHFGCILFGICVVVTVVVSLLTKPIDDVHLHRLTFWSRYSQAERIDIDVDEEIEQADPDVDWDSLPMYKKAGRWICGIEKREEKHELTPEEQKAIERKQLSIHETPVWRRVLNINAVVLMTLAVFLWGFYA